jgi:hypothetical protein
MSGFQAYLDGAERASGITPQGFLDLAVAEGLTDAKTSAIIAWLKTDHDLGHGHAANLAQLILKGPAAIATKYNGGAPLRLDGIAAPEL